MSTIITRPAGLSLRDWTDNVSYDLRAYGTFGAVDDESQWTGWALQLLSNPALSSNVPNPYQFPDWRAWASALCATLS